MTGLMGFYMRGGDVPPRVEHYSADKRVLDDPKKISEATHGREKGDCVVIHSHPDQTHGVHGKIVGVSVEGTALVLERPQRYQLTNKGYVVKPYKERFSLEFGSALVIFDTTPRELEGMMDHIPLVEHLGKDVVVEGAGEKTSLGRLQAVYPEIAYLQPFVRSPSSFSKGLWSLIKEYPLPIKPDSKVLFRFPEKLEKFVSRENKEIREDSPKEAFVFGPDGEPWISGRPLKK